jgi:hypothetical protein
MSSLNDDWGGQDLDLSENEVNEGLPYLKAGIYDVMCVDVENKKSRTGKMLVATFQDVNGTGQAKFNFNYVNASKDAQRIGGDQLKTWLTHAGHPNPDKPFSLGKDAMIGLKVRVFIEDAGSYMKNNKTYRNYDIKRFAVVDDHPAPGATGGPALTSGGAAASGASGGVSSTNLDDDIPF